MASGWTTAITLGFLALRAAPQDDADGERGRAALAALVARCLEEPKEPKSVPLDERERAFGIPFEAVELRGMRVLATSGVEEARHVARALAAARSVFMELTGLKTAFYPTGVRAYLLGTREAKDTFLEKHPALSPEARTRLARLEGSGVPGTADWAFWEGDEEKRLDALVRIGLGWLCDAQGLTIERATWLHEGLGFALTHALTGSYLTWFVPIRPGSVSRDADAIALLARMGDPGVDWARLAIGQFAPERGFDLEELLHLQPDEMDAGDYLRAHALVLYLLETHPQALGAVLARLSAGEDPRHVLEEAVGITLAELRTGMDDWLEGREARIARAEGRHTDTELDAAWAELLPYQRAGAVSAFQDEVARLDTQTLRWMRTLLGAAPAEVPPAEPAPFYDPKTHAPGQPIPRKRLASSDARAKDYLARLRPAPSPGTPRLAYDYDWGKGRVVRVEDPLEPELVFHNARLGLPPRADLARAQVLATLDRADERKLQAAFAHAYTDREGNVYPVTMFEVWASGQTFETPDVDTLGIVHEVLDEWKRWVAPVAANQQEPLYRVIGDQFKTCRHSRELRLVLADLFLRSEAAPRTGYEKHAYNLQALWAENDADPVALARLLPDGSRWESFLTDLTDRMKRDGKAYTRGRHRVARLLGDVEAVRAALWSAMETARMLPPPEPEPEGAHAKGR